MTDKEWEIVKKTLVETYPYKGGNQKKAEDYREIMNAIFYINKTGVQWHSLPKDFPPPTTVNYHYCKFSRDGFFEKLNDAVRALARTQSNEEKHEAPSAAVVDSQSVKSTPEANGNEVGVDGGKKINGRKRSIAVDTMGYIICICVHAANIYDGKAGTLLLDRLFSKFKIKKIWADNTYRGEFVTYAKDQYDCDVEIKSPTQKEFKPIKKRWVVERTFAWLTRNRRLVREYEKTPRSSETMVYIASSRLILKHATA